MEHLQTATIAPAGKAPAGVCVNPSGFADGNAEAARSSFVTHSAVQVDPFTYNISQHAWCWFCTLTFASRNERGDLLKVPDTHARRKMLFAFLRRAAEGNLRDRKTEKRTCVIPFPEFEWVAREERGEKGGRYHFHVLLAGFPKQRLNRVEEFSLRSIWQNIGGGFSDVRAFDASLRGVRYVLKGLQDWSRERANSFEASRFNESEDRSLILADACAKKWARRMIQGGTRGTQPRRLAESLSARRTRALEQAKETVARYLGQGLYQLGSHPAGVSFVR